MKITSTHSSEKHAIKALIYGESGIGKTFLASTLPNKTLIISAEAGLLSLANVKMDVVDLAIADSGTTLSKEMRLKKLDALLASLTTEEMRKRYDNIYVDSLTEISQNIIESFIESKAYTKSDALRMWGDYSQRLKHYVKTIRDLPGYNVVCTALVKFDKDDVQERYSMLDVQGTIGTQLPQFFDEVFFYNIVVGADKVPKRVLHTSKSDRFIAKDRSGKLNPSESPDLLAIFNKIHMVEKEKK